MKPTINNDTSLANMFMADVVRTVSRQRHSALAALSSADFMATPLKDRDVAWLAHCIKRCRGYRIEKEVGEAATKLLRNTYLSAEKTKKFNQALEQNPKLYAVPFPVMWVEWAGITSEGKPIKNGLILENIENPIGLRTTLVGWLKSGLATWTQSPFFPNTLTPILISAGSPKMMGCERIYPGRHGSQLAAEFEYDKDTIDTLKEISNDSYRMAICILMIMKSRTNILKLIEPAARVNGSSGVNSRNPALSPGKNLGLLTFDLTRILAKGYAASEEGARRLLAEQVVMGHFKLREVRRRDDEGIKLPGYEQQLIWWNPFWRGGTAEEQAAREGQQPIKAEARKAIISDSKLPLHIPGYGKAGEPAP